MWRRHLNSDTLCVSFNTVYCSQCPQQPNACDCGYYVLEFIRMVYSIDYTRTDVNTYNVFDDRANYSLSSTIGADVRAYIKSFVEQSVQTHRAVVYTRGVLGVSSTHSSTVDSPPSDVCEDKSADFVYDQRMFYAELDRKSE